ncbi:MAG: glycyl-radical enzyme activating protein [Clostridia bacterium]|nr:glycyl-radical enzyme activating protein [Clostridia bacterium]
MPDALFVDVQRGSVHDGPGIRTTFFLKGCPLHCPWCHNPESQSPAVQLSFHASRCILCGACASVCPAAVHRLSEAEPRHRVAFSSCIRCGACVQVCPREALKLIGTKMDAQEALRIALRDLPFYRASGGGITLSGGEPLLWEEFTPAFLKLCRENRLHTCIEMSGAARRDVLLATIPWCDLYYFDWKISDPIKLRELTGADRTRILGNLDALLAAGSDVTLRCPLIPGINDSEDHFKGILDVIRTRPAIREVHLLPYHDFGVGKAANTGVVQTRYLRASREDLDGYETWFAAHNDTGAVISIQK